MRITESQLRKIVREEILRESVYDNFGAGNVPYREGFFEAKNWEHITRAFYRVMDRTGNRRVMLDDLLAEMEKGHPRDYPDLYNRYLNYEGPSFIAPGFFKGTGLMLHNGAVQELVETMDESRLLEATMTATYQGKTYKASPGVVALLKKYNWDGAKAIADGKFNWAKKLGINPWSLIQAATIVGTGRPIARRPQEGPAVLEAKRTRSYGKRSYSASPGSVAAIKKHGDSAKKAVKAGAFDWASNPYAAANAAHIVATGEPTVRKGSKRKK